MKSFVYMIRAGDRCKIGKADNPEARIHSFRTGCPYPIETIGTIQVVDAKAALELEGFLHHVGTQWGLHRDREWFQYHPRLEAKFLAQGSHRGVDPVYDTYTLQSVLGALMTGAAVVRKGIDIVFDVSDFSGWYPPKVHPLALHFVEHPELGSDSGIICNPITLGPLASPEAVCDYHFADDHGPREDQLWACDLTGTWSVMPLSRLARIHELLDIPIADFSDDGGTTLDIKGDVETILEERS